MFSYAHYTNLYARHLERKRTEVTWFEQQVVILALVYLHCSISNVVAYAKVLTASELQVYDIYVLFFFFLKLLPDIFKAS